MFSEFCGLPKDDTSADDLVKVQSAAAEVMKAVKLTVENYPDLKANQLYSQVMAEIADQQENVNGAVAIFNLNVELHNNGIEQFPGSLVNSLFNKRQPITPFNDTAAQAQFDYQPNL
ncbi:TPA: LemA family protein [Pseudomonas aeruginosa]|uniref:LemA family protein n=1 Tax=Pseudomonas aeruginosa TaxID=287 RepID=UPI00104BE43C|nr:LemA family protein [Pseudomonas aeruginosa]MCU9458085.1 LemA family protein [Pseudomonas aeruginosa]